MTDRELYLHYIDLAIEGHMKAYNMLSTLVDEQSSLFELGLGMVFYGDTVNDAHRLGGKAQGCRRSAAALAHCDKGARNVWKAPIFDKREMGFLYRKVHLSICVPENPKALDILIEDLRCNAPGQKVAIPHQTPFEFTLTNSLSAAYMEGTTK